MLNIIYLCVHVEVRGQLVGIGSSSAMWLLELELRISNLAVSALTSDPSCWPLFEILKKYVL